jgi:hexosaminidase
LGEEGYQLTITPEAVKPGCSQTSRHFLRHQTFRQLLPSGIESASTLSGPWRAAAGEIRDFPRYAWRGSCWMFRHFFGVEDIKRYIDLLAYYR